MNHFEQYFLNKRTKARSSEIMFTVERVIRNDGGDIERGNMDNQDGKSYAIWQTSADYELRRW